MAGATRMSTRERRLWAKKLTEAQEAVEAAEEGRADVMKAAYEAGMSFASIEASTGLGPHTVRNNIDDTGRAGESQ